MKLMSLKETAEFIGVAVVTLRGYVKKNKIPFLKVGGRYKFDVEEVTKWIRGK